MPFTPALVGKLVSLSELAPSSPLAVGLERPPKQGYCNSRMRVRCGIFCTEEQSLDAKTACTAKNVVFQLEVVYVYATSSACLHCLDLFVVLQLPKTLAFGVPKACLKLPRCCCKSSNSSVEAKAAAVEYDMWSPYSAYSPSAEWRCCCLLQTWKGITSKAKKRGAEGPGPEKSHAGCPTRGEQFYVDFASSQCYFYKGNQKQPDPEDTGV